MNWEKTCSLIPDGVQTLSKMPSKHVEDVYPKYITKGQGSTVWGDDGKEYISYTCGLGAILLGHNYPATTQAIKDQMTKGLLFGLPNELETELAEKICDKIPSAEMCRFLKTGSEACSAAVKISRAYTGRNSIICCGYHGWHDWYNWTTSKNKGVPRQSVRQAKYNDIESFKITDKTAAVIMEPYVLDEPKHDFLKQVRKLCKKNGALLIFDEVVTGFRTKKWSAQAYFDVIPDLTCLGKALGNGLPIGVVCGRKEVMKVLEDDCFVSSTFGGELLSIASALATIDEIEERGVIEHIWQKGSILKGAFNDYTNGLDGVECIGLPPRTFFKFPTEAHKGLFWQECLKMGVMFGYAQFISFSHEQAQMDKTLTAMHKGVAMVKKYWEEPEKFLSGRPPQETFRLVEEKK